VPPAVNADQSLQRVEALLDQALDDLTGNRNASPCLSAADILTNVHSELQALAGLLTASEANQSILVARAKAIFPRLKTAERLLMAAGDFYLGWCAAAPASSYPAQGYQAEHPSHSPALLALEG
jgi:hypothetical protein